MSRTENLIDFSSKDLNGAANQEIVPKCSILSPENAHICLENNDDTINNTNSDNNPFDTVLEQMKLHDDPFEIVMQQAEGQKIASCQRLEVDTEDLLGLNENLSSFTEKENRRHKDRPLIPNFDSIDLECVSLSPILKGEPTRKTLGKSTSSGAHFSNDIRTQLLKLSVSSSPADSPLRRDSKTSDDSIESINGRKESPKLSSYEFNDSCDDLNAIKPNWVDSETEQDSDLELLNIPILQQMDKDAEKFLTVSSETIEKSVDSQTKHTQKTNDNNITDKSSSTIDLEMIRDRVRRHNLGKNNTQDVGDIISSMKKILLECENQQQKIEATRLLDSLSALFSETKENSKPPEIQLNDAEKAFQEKSQVDVGLDVPQPIVRQGTFDLDKSHKSNSFENIATESSLEDKDDCSSNLNRNASQSSVTQDVSSIVEQISMLFGNQNVNVVQTNIGASDNAVSNPTYIVVMGAPNSCVPHTPIRQNTQILMKNSSSPEFPQEVRNRSNSLSLHDKPAKQRTFMTPSSPTVFNTPARTNTLRRRSTISFSPSAAAPLIARKSFCNPLSIQKPVTLQRRQSLNSDRDITSQRVNMKNISHAKIDSNARSLKLKCSENSQRKVGPLKATMPIRNGLPSIVNSSKMKLTNTPIAPVACSTPSAMSPPDTFINKFRTPLSVTPKPKATVKSNLSGVYRRRSLTDSKSPKRCNTTGQPSRMSTGFHQFVKKSGLNISAKNLGQMQPKNKENNPPK